MKPEDVPADLYDLALDALPGEPDEVISATTQEEVRAALAAVIPEIQRRERDRAADELFQRFQRMREDGEHDMRTALHHVRDVLRSEP